MVQRGSKAGKFLAVLPTAAAHAAAAFITRDGPQPADSRVLPVGRYAVGRECHVPVLFPALRSSAVRTTHSVDCVRHAASAALAMARLCDRSNGAWRFTGKHCRQRRGDGRGRSAPAVARLGDLHATRTSPQAAHRKWR